MKKFICFSLIFILANASFSQSGWRWQNPYPQGNGLNSIVMNGSVGWAVGTLGTVMHTINQGHDWEVVDIGTTETLNCIYISNIAEKGWIVGNNGLVYYSGDNGQTWEKQYSGTSEILYSVSAIEGNCPWICGNDIILKSYNDGETWNRVNSIFHSRFYALDHKDCEEVWIAGEDGLVINTTDAGGTWQSHATPTSRDLYSIDIVDNGDYRACGYAGTIIHSSDDGNTWFKENENSGYALKNIATKGIVGEAYAVGDDGIILKGLYSDPTWNPAESGTFCNLHDVCFQALFHGVYVTGQYGIVLRKPDEAGAEFEIMNERINCGTNAVAFANKNKGWAAGGRLTDLSGSSKGVILQTTDGGDTWETRQSLSKAVIALDVIDENHVWAVGREGLIIYTSNGGESWATPQSPLNGTLTSVCFVDEDNGWIVSMSNWGQIIRTQNGGLSWTQQVNPTSNPLYDVFFIDQNKGWAVGLDSTILRTSNGGQTWERLITNAIEGYRFASVFFIDEMKGWVVGIYGSILLTEDGGVTWQEINSGTSKLLNSVYFIDHQNGWIAGDQGTILRSMDGGYTWINQYNPVATNTLTSVYFNDHLTGWVSGEGGSILRTDNGGFMHPPGTFWKDNLGLPINDNEETNSTIDVNVESFGRDGYYLTGVELYIDSIMHSRVSDLEISLKHNDVTQTLVYHVADQGENFLWTKLCDEATGIITDGISPFSGNYKPYEPLSAFNGMNPNGDWTLCVFDNETGHTGTLNAWGIKPMFEKVFSINGPSSKGPDQKVRLFQNVPNPFTGITQIKWKSDLNGFTTLKVFNIHGQEIKTLINRFQTKGDYSVGFDGSLFSPGIYYYRLQVGNCLLTRKCVIL